MNLNLEKYQDLEKEYNKVVLDKDLYKEKSKNTAKELLSVTEKLVIVNKERNKILSE